MTDTRSRLADALRDHPFIVSLCITNDAVDGIAELVTSLPGIVIVELPERLPGYTEDQKPQWEMAEIVIRTDDHGWVRLNSQALEPWEARAVAARLLAAAAAVQAQEEKPK